MDGVLTMHGVAQPEQMPQLGCLPGRDRMRLFGAAGAPLKFQRIL